MASILLTGGYGFLASHLANSLKSYQGHGVHQASHQELDITSVSAQQIEKIRARFDIVVNLAAYTNVTGAEENIEHVFRINADCLDWLNNLGPGIDIYQISTDYVYDSMAPNSKETDILKPFGVYGASKAAADTRLLSTCNPCMHIIRTSFKPVEWQWPGAFTNILTNADTVDIISEMLAELILACPPGGVYNIGTEPKTVYELAKKNNPAVKPILRSPGTLIDTTMDLTKYQKFIGSKRDKNE